MASGTQKERLTLIPPDLSPHRLPGCLRRRTHLSFCPPCSVWPQIHLCLGWAHSILLAPNPSVPGLGSCFPELGSSLAWPSSALHLHPSMARNKGFTDTLHQGWLSLATNSLLSRQRQPTAGDKDTLRPNYSTFSLTSPPALGVLKSQQRKRLAAGSPWLPITPRLHRSRVPHWPFLSSLPKSEGRLHLIQLYSWCQPRAHPGPQHTHRHSTVFCIFRHPAR